MIGIRTKLILFMSSLVIIIGTFSCLFFLIHAKRQQEEALKSFGTSLVMLLAQDIEVKHALSYSQHAFLDTPVKRIKALDREGEIAYLRISGIHSVLSEEKAPWLDIEMKEIPAGKGSQNLGILLTDCILASSREAFYDFSVPVLETAFSEEVFAAQVLEIIPVKTRQYTLGFVQIGLSPDKLNKRIHKILWRSVIPMGLIIILGGISITIFLTKYIVLPLQQMAGITLDIARGDLTRTVKVYSKDEIGQLSMNFNHMTHSLKISYDELKQEIAERKRTEALLKYRARIEELLATISTYFINLAPDEVDIGINRALKMIGEFAGVDRSYVFLYSDGEEKMDNSHEWCAEGIQPQKENLKGVPVHHFPWGMEKLRQFETIHIPRVSELSDCANAERELLQSQDIQSLVIVPMIYGGSTVGLLGFDSVRRETAWTSEDITMLKMVAEIFVNALEHKRMEEMLRKANSELEMRVLERTVELSNANELLKEEIAEHKKAKDELRKYEILISEISDLPYICDASGNVLFVNRTFKKLTGHKPEEFIGKPFAPLFDEENLKKAMDFYARTLNGESLEFELLFKDTGILCEYKNLPLRDENGNIIGVIGIARDITERQRMINALRQAKVYAENLIETANVMVVGLDVMGNIQIFNKAAEEITGYKKVEVRGKNWFEIIGPRDKHPHVWLDFTKWQSGGQLIKAFENHIFTKSGRKRYISWQNSEVREQGKVTGTISFGIDITEQKRTKELVERMRLTAFVRDVGIALTEGNTLHEILRHCAEAIVNNLDAAFARIWTLNEEENVLELQASAGMYTHRNGSHSRIPVGKFKVGLIARERKPHLTNSVIDDPYISDKNWVKREGMVAFAGYPLVVQDRLVGVVAMFSRKSFSEFIFRALASASDIIALGIARKQGEETLRMSERKYRILLENLPQKIFYKDKNSIYVSCNENYARDLNIQPDEIVGKTDYDFFHKNLAEKYIADDRRIMRSGQTEDMEEKYTKEGRELIVHTVKTPIRDERGEIIGILGVFWDVTEKVALQMEAIRSRHLVSLGELAAGVAHEINNPITGIINCAQILVNKSHKGSRENDVAHRIVKEGYRIANIVKSLLYFARPTDRKEQRSAVHVREILSDTLVLIEAQLKKDSIKLTLNIPEELTRIIVYPQQIQQVFLNIISNARYALNCKYPGKHDRKILEIRAEEVTMKNCPSVKVAFYDQGTGIPANILDKVMNPFFTTKPRGKGTGLGLSISHGVISDHGGQLLIDSVEGEFTEAAVILPAVSEH